jgi:hypothetical protein
MSGMFNFADIFQFVVNCFNNRSFPEKYFISHCHQAVFHIVFDTGNQVQTILKKQRFCLIRLFLQTAITVIGMNLVFFDLF